MLRNDPLWKGIIQDLVFPFLHFFFPSMEFDENKKPEFLDKELEQIILRTDTDPKRRLVDKLIKVWTLSGEEQWFLIHIEVQGYWDRELPKRMFQCFYRILDSHKKPVTSLVIYTDKDPGFKPQIYHYKLAETELLFSFGTFKILDQSEEELDKSENPFALIILTVLTSLTMKSVDKNQMIDMKIKLVRRLIEKDYDRPYIKAMMNFIRFYVRFPKENMNFIFEKRVEELITNKDIPMGVEEIILQQVKEEGIEEGLEKQLYNVIKKMIIKGKSTDEICELLDVRKAFVSKIQKDILR